MRLPAATLLLALAGCRSLNATDLASSEDYDGTRYFNRFGEHEAALALFPAKEPGAFVTTMERGWLALLARRPDPEPLLAMGRDLEARKTVRVSREAAAFFYKETHEGYIPAEHEAVLFHVVTGFSLVARQRLPEAQIEARRAARYLQADFGATKEFDDPALRLWLATLWAMTGDWESARVDLRRAATLDPQLVEAAHLAGLASPPAHLVLALEGSGPEAYWKGTAGDAASRIEFVAKGTVPELVGPGSIALTAPWYARHHERNTALKEVLTHSRYMVEAFTGTAASAALTATSITLGVATGTLGIAAGGAIIYYGLQAVKDVEGAIGVIALGIMVAGAGVSAGSETIDVGSERAKEALEDGVGQARYVRFVRFLPSRVRIWAPAELGSLRNAVAARKDVRAIAAVAKGAGRPETVVYHVGHVASAPKAPTTSTSIIHFPLSGERMFAAHADSMTYEAAKAACDLAPQATREAWKLPDTTDVEKSIELGVLEERPNNLLKARLVPGSRVWVMRGEADEACATARLRAVSEREDARCDEKHAVLCITSSP